MRTGCHHMQFVFLWPETTIFQRSQRAYLCPESITICCGQSPKPLKSHKTGRKWSQYPYDRNFKSSHDIIFFIGKYNNKYTSLLAEPYKDLLWPEDAHNLPSFTATFKWNIWQTNLFPWAAPLLRGYWQFTDDTI